tara:strand:- start:534 stop:686 length:153 start_codon:yes stop_codon:yes gene_type:complete
MNQILKNHADWLEENGQHSKARECRKQAVTFVKIGYDTRQTGRKYERKSI